jgi:hypothetical protein
MFKRPDLLKMLRGSIEGDDRHSNGLYDEDGRSKDPFERWVGQECMKHMTENDVLGRHETEEAVFAAVFQSNACKDMMAETGKVRNDHDEWMQSIFSQQEQGSRNAEPG